MQALPIDALLKAESDITVANPLNEKSALQGTLEQPEKQMVEVKKSPMSGDKIELNTSIK